MVKADTTMRDELTFIKKQYQRYNEAFAPPTLTLLRWNIRGSLETLSRLSEDVDESVREECEQLIKELDI